MSRVTDILDNVRDILSDEDKQRWTDAKLLRLFNEGLKTWVIGTGTHKTRGYIPLEVNTALYDMSPYSFNIDRIQYMNIALEAKTEEEMDAIEDNWQDTVGPEPLYVIFSNYKQGLFRIYPKVTELAADNITYNSLYGALIDIEIVDELLQIPQIDNLLFGTTKYLVVFYTGKPSTVTLTTADAELNINPLYDIAITSYISGQALRLDADTLNRAFGAEQLQYFTALVTRAKTKEAVSNNSLSLREVKYKGFQ